MADDVQSKTDQINDMQSQESPSPAPSAPVAAASAMSGGTPAATQQPTAQQPAVRPNPAAAVQSHQNFLGKAVSSLMGVDYQVDPKTGATSAVSRPSKPGDLFRHILAGAIIGQAAGSGARDFGEGAGRGGAAEIQDLRKQDDQRFQRAQEQFKNQQEATRTQNEQMFQQAQIAHMHTQDIAADAQMDLVQQEHIDSLNRYNDTLTDATEKAGGVKAPIMIGGQDINGQQGNGKAIQESLTKDPQSLMRAPDGYHRIHTQSVDYNGLKFKAGTGWVDKDNNPVDLSSRTTHSFYDVPQNVFNERVSLSGKELNDLTGMNVFKEGDTRTVSYGELTSLKANATKNKMEETRNNLLKAQIGVDLRKASIEAKDVDLKKEQMNRQDALTAITGLRTQLQGLKDKKSSDPFAANNKDIDDQIDYVEGKLRGLDKFFEDKLGIKPATTESPITKPAALGTDQKKSSEAINNTISIMQEDNNIDPGSEEAYDYISKSNLSPADKEAAIKQYATIPISVVQQYAQRQGVTIQKQADIMKKAGFKIAQTPSENKEAEGAAFVAESENP